MSLGSDCSLATHRRVRAACERIRAAAIEPLRDMTPAYATVVLSFDVMTVDAARVEAAVRHALEGILERRDFFQSRLVEVPVCYEGELAPDIEDVARLHGMSVDQVAALHSGTEYVACFVGFVPGFAYLGGLPQRLATPRLQRPRVRVPAGSVGIAGEQTGVYPFATPGGWRLVGRTPVRMFDAGREGPGLIEMGDRVRFVRIGAERFREMENALQNDAAGADAHGVGSADGPTSARSRIRVIEPGMLTTVQDLGREGFASMGAPVGGAADRTSLRAGNRLLGNQDDAAGLEMTLIGGCFEFAQDTDAVVIGADAEVMLDSGREAGIGGALHVRRGEKLKVGRMRHGARAYLCVRGGIDVPPIMGSCSTHLAAGIGGYQGRALRAGDCLKVVDVEAKQARVDQPGQALYPRHLRSGSGTRTVRIVLRSGFLPAAVAAFLGAEYKIASQSDRVGLRLEGPPIEPPGGGQMISEGMMWGAVQAPENGKPIVLMADHPTTGGYPVIGCVASIDLPLLGQLRPGDVIRFEAVDGETARQLVRALCT